MTSLLHNKDVNDILYRTWREVLLHCGVSDVLIKIRCFGRDIYYHRLILLEPGQFALFLWVISF